VAWTATVASGSCAVVPSGTVAASGGAFTATNAKVLNPGFCRQGTTFTVAVPSQAASGSGTAALTLASAGYGGTGITVAPGQHFCWVLGEHGGDAVGGATHYHHFFAANDAATGKRLANSPAVVNWTTANSNLWGGQSTVGDMFDLFRSTTATTTANEQGWGGEIGPVEMVWAYLPNASDTPTAGVLSALCAKTGPVLTGSISGTTLTTSVAPAYSLVGFQLAGDHGEPDCNLRLRHKLDDQPNEGSTPSEIGQTVEGFRIGTSSNPALSGDDDVFDPIVGGSRQVSQSNAFTCTLVANSSPYVVQCVRASGAWTSGGTYLTYLDRGAASRAGTLRGNVGGGSLGFTAGSGYTNGTYTLTGSGDSCSTEPTISVTVSEGAISNVFPSTPGGLRRHRSAFTVSGMGSGTDGAISSVSGNMGTWQSDANTLGQFLYDNAARAGTTFGPIFNGNEPGLPVKPAGIITALSVSR
jgi:hypothetical protein